MNLAVNARDALDGKGNIWIESSQLELGPDFATKHGLSPGSYVKISVTDDGPGVPTEIRSKIFEPFFTTKDRSKGTGLGLAVAFSIARRSGGHIACYSEVGHGASFKLYLPSVGNVNDKTPSRDAPIKVATILLVEDEDEVRTVARRTLESVGHRVIACSNGQQAIELFQQGSADIDLVATDLLMPKMGGSELVRRIREERNDVAIILLSGYNESLSRRDIVEGCLFLEKPFTPNELRRKVQEALG
jgi:CheY-like chemotaxis protein